MKVLVTGARGFIGRNLCLSLRQMSGIELLPCDLGDAARLPGYAAECDFAMHLAGVNRPENPEDFKTGNAIFTEELLGMLSARANPPPVLLSSSIQAALDNDYGRSKLAAERSVADYGAKTGAPVYIYRLANVFGKWARPAYNSAVATWTHNIARDLPVSVRDPAATVTLVYIDDVVESFVSRLDCRPADGILSVSPQYVKTLGEIVELIKSFRREPETLMVPDQSDGFTRKLYATYLAALPEDRYAYPLHPHCDSRGSFTEVLRSADRGQVSVNISKPGIAKGRHWHHTKHEKFVVVAGKGEIRFRVADDPAGRICVCKADGASPSVVRIPPGSVHEIVNTGDTDLVTLMWANENFDPARPDTFAQEL